MNRYLRIAALVVVLAVVAAACGGGGAGEPSPTGSAGGAVPTGGTLTTVMTEDFFNGLDPTQEYYSVSWAFLRCCMARTMLNYTGKPVDEGGGVPQPDLAAAEPTVSEDQLTWTFTLKDGVMFGDPLNREIVAQDFVNAINRLSDPKINTPGYPYYYTAIEGFSDAKGKQVSGVVATNDKTLTITLTTPEPDMPFLFTMAATAPLPDELIDAHYDAVELGQFLVSSGPYQWEGMTPEFDLTGDEPPTGMQIGESYVFVRNPSWDPSTDDLRKAYVDRIEITVGGETQDNLDKVTVGDVDWCIDCSATASTLRDYTADPELQSRISIHPSDALSYTGLNVFQAPFDDVHVRKAVNWAYDKDAAWRLAGGPPSGEIAGHFIPPGMMSGLNADYNPYGTEGDQGDPEAAKAEMALSKYDTDGDGVCDDPSCDITALTYNDPDAIKGLEIMDASFDPIGISLDIKTLAYNALVAKCATPASHMALCQAAWGKDFSDPYTFFFPLLDGGENGSNYSFMGATGDALTEAGYSGFETDDAGLAVPNITQDIVDCRALPFGPEYDECWAALDRKVIEELASVIPRRFPNDIDVLSANVVNYSYDQFTGVGAVDQIAVSSGSTAAS